MKRLLLSIALLLIASTWASAESSVWKAQKGNFTIYLGGTFQVLREMDYPLPPEFDQAYDAADVVVFESDFARLKDPSTQRKFLAKAMYAHGGTVEKHLSPETYGDLAAYCEANGIPLDTVNQLKPSMLITTLKLMKLLKSGVTKEGVDGFFYGRAKQENKEIEGLQTIDKQLNRLLTLADGNEDQYVDLSIEDMKVIGRQFELSANAWRTGDAEKLVELLNTQLKIRQPKLYKKMIVDRNRTWLPLISSYRNKPQTRFVLLDVGNLVGPDGIITALKTEGYTVEKL